MKSIEFIKAIKSKTVELELAIEFKKPHEEILKLYKQLKRLYYQKLELEQSESKKGLGLV